MILWSSTVMSKKQLNKPKYVSVSENTPSRSHIKIIKLSHEESIKRLKSAGFDVTEKEAEEIMEFLYLLAEIMLKELINNR